MGSQCDNFRSFRKNFYKKVKKIKIFGEICVLYSKEEENLIQVGQSEKTQQEQTIF